MTVGALYSAPLFCMSPEPGNGGGAGNKLASFSFSFSLSFGFALGDEPEVCGVVVDAEGFLDSDAVALPLLLRNAEADGCPKGCTC